MVFELNRVPGLAHFESPNEAIPAVEIGNHLHQFSVGQHDAEFG